MQRFYMISQNSYKIGGWQHTELLCDRNGDTLSHARREIQYVISHAARVIPQNNFVYVSQKKGWANDDRILIVW